MNFLQACEVRMTSGQYRNRTIGDVGVTGEGLLYLDALAASPTAPLDTIAAVECYLSDESIRQELDELLGRISQ